jgi:hypothetical protein
MSLFDAYQSSVPQYDELFDQAGVHINEASFLYIRFITDLLERIGTQITLDDVAIPVYRDSSFPVMHAHEIFFDEHGRFPMVSMRESAVIPFSELNLVAQDLISQNLFLEIKTADIYRQMNPSSGSEEK